MHGSVCAKTPTMCICLWRAWCGGYRPLSVSHLQCLLVHKGRVFPLLCRCILVCARARSPLRTCWAEVRVPSPPRRPAPSWTSPPRRAQHHHHHHPPPHPPGTPVPSPCGRRSIRQGSGRSAAPGGGRAHSCARSGRNRYIPFITLPRAGEGGRSGELVIKRRKNEAPLGCAQDQRWRRGARELLPGNPPAAHRWPRGCVRTRHHGAPGPGASDGQRRPRGLWAA